MYLKQKLPGKFYFYVRAMTGLSLFSPRTEVVVVVVVAAAAEEVVEKWMEEEEAVVAVAECSS
jgi:hypothetical protein